MDKLYIWAEGFRIYKKIKGVPHSIDVRIRDRPATHPGEWYLYDHLFHGSFPSGQYKLPEELHIVVPRGLIFDYLGWSKGVKIVSERMLSFLKEHNITDGYETARVASVFNCSGKVIETEHQYYVIRFYKFDDDLMELNSDLKIRARGSGGGFLYPSMSIKDGVVKGVFTLYLDGIVYDNSLIITEKIKQEIEARKFIGPVIYPMDEFHIAYNGQ